MQNLSLASIRAIDITIILRILFRDLPLEKK